VSLQKELESSLGVKPKIRWGSTGQFDVIVDGATVFSFDETGRMPTSDEIVAIIKPA